MEKLSMQTTNVVDENIKKIGELFPNCLTETLDEKGRPQTAIDFDLLRQELSKDIVEGPEERYQFTWPDKRNAIRLANAPTTDTLRPCRVESVDFDNTQNLYIEGDNLQVLKLLRENYLGKVKMIYIDPPYNTGNDFVYNDDFAQATGEYIHNSGQEDEEGNRLVANTESNGRFHTDWLNMMYSRLRLAKDLLSFDGIIFISIDDNEIGNLKKICDEVFGQPNFIANFIWEKRKTRENRKAISVRHDSILCYVKDFNNRDLCVGLEEMNDEAKERYKNPDNDPRGLWTSVPAIAQGGHGTKNQFYTFTAPNGKTYDPPSGSCWRYTLDKMQEAIADNRIWFGSDGNGVPRIKKFLNEGKQGLTPETILNADKVGTNDSAKRELVSLFDNVAVFETPKPVSLLKHLLSIIEQGSNSTFVDFFSGTATFAHAVIQLNAEDGGNRRFIMVQLPEETDENSDAFKAGYKNICEIGKERIRRAGKKILEEKKVKQGDLFCGDQKLLDVGFRVLKLDSSNMQDVYYTPGDFNEQKLFDDNIKPDRTDEDLLFQTMIELGIELSARIEKREIAGKTVWNVSNGYLMACFDEDVKESTIIEIARQHPYYFVMRDSSLATDNVADNFEQIWEEYSKDTVRRII